MSHLQILSSVEQVAAHLRKELISGQRVGIMPGVLRLEAELGINRNIVEGGLRLLETEGLLELRGGVGDGISRCRKPGQMLVGCGGDP